MVRLSHPHLFSHLRLRKRQGELWAGPTGWVWVDLCVGGSFSSPAPEPNWGRGHPGLPAACCLGSPLFSPTRFHGRKVGVTVATLVARCGGPCRPPIAVRAYSRRPGAARLQGACARCGARLGSSWHGGWGAVGGCRSAPGRPALSHQRGATRAVPPAGS